jgi:hypothetical protein
MCKRQEMETGKKLIADHAKRHSVVCMESGGGVEMRGCGRARD